MMIVFYAGFCYLAGWLGGEAFRVLQRAKESGRFEGRHWLIFFAVMAGGMAYARFFISSRRSPLISDTAVGIGAAVLAIAFVLQSRMFRAEGDG